MEIVSGALTAIVAVGCFILVSGYVAFLAYVGAERAIRKNTTALLRVAKEYFSVEVKNEDGDNEAEN